MLKKILRDIHTENNDSTYTFAYCYGAVGFIFLLIIAVLEYKKINIIEVAGALSGYIVAIEGAYRINDK
jgi:hypothetical protein